MQQSLGPLVEETGQNEAAGQRNQYADEGDHKGGRAALFQLAQVGLQTGVEHEHDNAQLGQLIHQGGLLQHTQHGGTQQQAGQQRAYHLRQGKPLGDDTEDLGAEQDHRNFKQKMVIHTIHSPLQKDKIKHHT